jgi:hypothetical protein
MTNAVGRARKLGIIARVAARQAGRNRGVNALWQAGRTTATHVSHILGQLWLEVTGFIFLCLSGIGAIAIVREYNRYTAGKATAGRVWVAVIFTLMFGWFGLSSFWRVRKKTKR